LTYKSNWDVSAISNIVNRFFPVFIFRKMLQFNKIELIKMKKLLSYHLFLWQVEHFFHRMINVDNLMDFNFRKSSNNNNWMKKLELFINWQNSKLQISFSGFLFILKKIFDIISELTMICFIPNERVHDKSDFRWEIKNSIFSSATNCSWIRYGEV
jgi:hypothetical protein